jgi:predicted nucleic acid-binding protein
MPSLLRAADRADVILVDTSVWIDHLHRLEPLLVESLGRDDVGTHRFVIEELALGSIKRRDELLGLLADLRGFPVLSHVEVLTLVDARRLWGRGLSAADAHLLGSVALVDGAALWTRDKRLLAACRDAEISVVEESG